jgi:hypothetical protein
MKTYPPQDDGPDRDRRGFFRQALGATAITAAAAAAASVTARADLRLPISFGFPDFCTELDICQTSQSPPDDGLPGG